MRKNFWFAIAFLFLASTLVLAQPRGITTVSFETAGMMRDSFVLVPTSNGTTVQVPVDRLEQPVQWKAWATGQGGRGDMGWYLSASQMWLNFSSHPQAAPFASYVRFGWVGAQLRGQVTMQSAPMKGIHTLLVQDEYEGDGDDDTIVSVSVCNQLGLYCEEVEVRHYGVRNGQPVVFETKRVDGVKVTRIGNNSQETVALPKNFDSTDLVSSGIGGITSGAELSKLAIEVPPNRRMDSSTIQYKIQTKRLVEAKILGIICVPTNQ